MVVKDDSTKEKWDVHDRPLYIVYPDVLSMKGETS
jgi:hypothetical protein